MPSGGQLRAWNRFMDAAAQQADHALIRLRVPQNPARVFYHRPIAHLPPGAIHQRSQTGLGKNPIIGFIAAKTIAVRQKSYGKLAHRSLPIWRATGNSGAEQAVAAA